MEESTAAHCWQSPLSDDLKNATNETDKSYLLEKALREGAKSAEWSKFAQMTTLPPEGTTYLFDLHAGPWIIFMDRGGLITQCYRVIVGTGYKNELVAERTVCPASRNCRRKAVKKTRQ